MYWVDPFYEVHLVLDGNVAALRLIMENTVMFHNVMKNNFRLSCIFGIMIICGFLLSCKSSHPKFGLNSCHQLTADELEHVLDVTAPWPEFFSDQEFNQILAKGPPMDFSNIYSLSDWEKLMDGAQYLQNCEPSSIVSVLIEYQCGSWRNTNSPVASRLGHNLNREENDSKLALILRVMFELPEAAPAELKTNLALWSYTGIGPTGKTHELNINLDGTINLAWPIVWHEGQPELLSLRPGMNGVDYVYRVVDEYMYFATHYRLRDLNRRRKGVCSLKGSCPLKGSVRQSTIRA